MLNRIITGVSLFVAFLLVAYLDNIWLNFALFVALVAVAFLESLKLYGIENKLLVVIPLAFFTLLPFLDGLNDVFKVISLNLIVVASVLAFVKSDDIKIILPFIYPIAPIFLMFALYRNFGMSCLFWLIFSVVASDSGAYFVGKFLGKHKFSNSSPNKTIEGVAGGFILGSILGSIFAFIFVDIDAILIVLCSILISLFGVFGDLFESYLKRRVDLKDTSNILGEQGGILDRIDGYLFGAVAMFLVLA